MTTTLVVLRENKALGKLGFTFKANSDHVAINYLLSRVELEISAVPLPRLKVDGKNMARSYTY
jgi:hypothetical protein